MRFFVAGFHSIGNCNEIKVYSLLCIHILRTQIYMRLPFFVYHHPYRAAFGHIDAYQLMLKLGRMRGRAKPLQIDMTTRKINQQPRQIEVNAVRKWRQRKEKLHNILI